MFVQCFVFVNIIMTNDNISVDTLVNFYVKCIIINNYIKNIIVFMLYQQLSLQNSYKIIYFFLLFSQNLYSRNTTANTNI